MTEKRDNSGSMSVNNRKEKDTHPDWSGSAMIDGKEYWISGWTKEGRNGEFYSLAFKPKDERRPAQSPAPQRKPPLRPAARRNDMDDDSIPF